MAVWTGHWTSKKQTSNSSSEECSVIFAMVQECDTLEPLMFFTSPAIAKLLFPAYMLNHCGRKRVCCSGQIQAPMAYSTHGTIIFVTMLSRRLGNSQVLPSGFRVPAVSFSRCSFQPHKVILVAASSHTKCCRVGGQAGFSPFSPPRMVQWLCGSHF